MGDAEPVMKEFVPSTLTEDKLNKAVMDDILPDQARELEGTHSTAPRPQA